MNMKKFYILLNHLMVYYNHLSTVYEVKDHTTSLLFCNVFYDINLIFMCV